MMEKIWEASIFSTGVIVFLIISLIVILYCVCFSIKSRSAPDLEKEKIISIVIIAILTVINFQCIYDRYIELQYARRNSIVVEGEVENFHYDINGADSFSVNGVYFSYPVIETSIGYDIPKREKNSVIEHEGQYVKITYYTKSGVNIIIKIETIIGQIKEEQPIIN